MPPAVGCSAQHVAQDLDVDVRLVAHPRGGLARGRGRSTAVTIDFRVDANTVTIIRARFGRCTHWPVMGDLDLRGEKLRWVEDPLAPR